MSVARITWVDDRLRTWGAWRARNTRGGNGYPVQAAFSRLAVDRSGCVDLPVVEIEEEMSRIDRAVEALRHTGRTRLWEVVFARYVLNAPVPRIAGAFQVAPRTVHAQLEDADRAIAAGMENAKLSGGPAGRTE